jgi:hypothetical protein
MLQASRIIVLSRQVSESYITAIYKSPVIKSHRLTRRHIPIREHKAWRRRRVRRQLLCQVHQSQTRKTSNWFFLRLHGSALESVLEYVHTTTTYSNFKRDQLYKFRYEKPSTGTRTRISLSITTIPPNLSFHYLPLHPCLSYTPSSTIPSPNSNTHRPLSPLLIPLLITTHPNFP